MNDEDLQPTKLYHTRNSSLYFQLACINKTTHLTDLISSEEVDLEKPTISLDSDVNLILNFSSMTSKVNNSFGELNDLYLPEFREIGTIIPNSYRPILDLDLEELSKKSQIATCGPSCYLGRGVVDGTLNNENKPFRLILPQEFFEKYQLK
jgi:hypothetical protein